MSECEFAVEAFHAYIESIGLSRPAGTLGELKAFKAGADWQRSLAQAELAALKAKAAVPDWMASSSQFAERAYHAGWRDIADAQHEGIAVMYDELFASAPAQPQSDAVQSNDGEVIELLAKLRQIVCATPQNDMDRSGVWISTNHPVIKRIDALLGGDQ